MIIHYSKVELRNGKYYYTKDISPTDKLVTAKVLFFSNGGELECDFNFKEGVFNGVQKLYKDTYFQLSSEENYTNGILNGHSKYYKNGQLEKEIMYKDGQPLK